MSNNQIHPSSIIHPKASIGDNVTIGPFCIIGENVKIANNVKIQSHVSIHCRAEIGENVEISPFVSIGISQDRKYKGEDTGVIIGKNTVIREHVTINNGSIDDELNTTIGEGCLLMIGVHIAHDCIVGDNVIIANNTVLGGHVRVGDNAVIGGMSAVHPKVRIGKHAILGGMSAVSFDVIPYGSVKNERASLEGLNIIGMKRRGYSRSQIMKLNQFFQDLFHDTSILFNERIEKARERYADNEQAQAIIEFITEDAGRNLCLPKNKNKD